MPYIEFLLSVIEIMNILFVCRANMQRSQMAEAFFNASAPKDWHASSAGTHLEGNKGHPLSEFQDWPDNFSVTVMKEKGIDISRSTIKPVSPQLLESMDKIIDMA